MFTIHVFCNFVACTIHSSLVFIAFPTMCITRRSNVGLMAFGTLDKTFGYIFAQYIIISSIKLLCADR